MASAESTPIPAGSRYAQLVKIGTGGTASVYVARVTGAAEFSRLVAVKRPHPHLVHDPASRRAFVAEAAIASRIHHANVVAVQDVEAVEDELLLVMEYIEGASLAELLAAPASGGPALPAQVALRILLDAAAGLTAVHELEDDRGKRLGVLHRDVSPQNILVGLDGTARVSDLGLARRPASRASEAQKSLWGKLAYLAPELLSGAPASVRSEVFSFGVVLWEALSGQRLFRGAEDLDTLDRLRAREAPLLSSIVPDLGTALDAVAAKALAKAPEARFASMRDLGAALHEAARAERWIASAEEVRDHVRAAAGALLARRREMLRAAGGDASTGLKTTQTAPLVAPPAALRTTQTAPLVAPPAALRTTQTAPLVRPPAAAEAPPEAAPEAPPEEAAIAPPEARPRWDLGARSRLGGAVVACSALVVAACLWIAGSAEGDRPAARPESAAPPAEEAHAVIAPAPAAAPAPPQVKASPPAEAPPPVVKPKPRAPAGARIEKSDPAPERPEDALGF